MHLTNKQITTLLSPFLVAGVLFYFKDDIIQNIQSFFPKYEEYSNKALDKKASIYLQIESKDKLYQEIQNAVTARKENALWIADNILYTTELEKEKIVKRTQKPVVITTKPKPLKLQAVFPEDNVAIINGHFVKKGSHYNGVEILNITQEGIQIKSKKGKKWIYLFH